MQYGNKTYHSNKLKNSHVYSIAAIHDVLLWRHRTIYINWHNTTLCVTWRRGPCEEVGNPLTTLGFIVSLLKLVEQRIICPVEIFTTAPCWLLILCMFIMIYGRISLDKLPCTLVVYFVDKSRGARTYIVRLSWPTTASSNSELWTQPADNVSQPRWNHEEISVPFTLFALAYLSISRAIRVKVSLMISFIFRVRIGCEKKVFPLK